MNLLDLVTHMRKSMLDDTGGVGVEWADLTEEDTDSAQLRWSNEELTRFIDQAVKRAVRAALLIKKSEAAFDLTITAGVADYALDERIIRLKYVESVADGRQLEQGEIEDFIGIQSWRTRTGTPISYIADESDNTIKLYPIPVIDDTLNLTYHRLPLVDLSWTDNTVTPEIPSEYQIEMLDYAAYLAYMKDEANTFDPARATTYLALFSSNFTTTSAYSELRRKRSRGRGVAYGGIPHRIRERNR